MDDQRTDRASGGSLRFHKLRVAFSVGCGVLFLLLIALWLRSYSWHDKLSLANLWNGYTIGGQSVCGRVEVGIYSAVPEWSLKSWKAHAEEVFIDGLETPCLIVVRPDGWGTITFHWFAAVLVATLAVIAWLHWRFSLRTLLIAMTLVAVVLGWAAWNARK